ncbi:Cystathionine beta-lyase PatB [Gemella morbillorum]|uniref:cysteine-S-conjugate beta-lyase n=1 Tax=Gemella morbillorum TaxID=29391 RepID=A0A2X4NC74_9BACL|nr:MalY/PatB family protein [Gemella morbillorum]EFV36323.1 aminotransferase class I and II [Gemella morbillorum M424]QGS09292.1 putative C-S lyase [Gemella morbillorum]UBH80193.1 pyridoxal phosphate-dependent aminotransferase [Gemella morbillorum]SQH55578.1 Cystathionine beta-lyase PatB [Gemella morbillorum]
MSIVEEFVKNYYVERRNTNSLKWDALEERFGDENLLALWVADMEFKTPECIREDLNKRIEHGVFGYTKLPESYYDAYKKWHKNRYDYEVNKDWIRFAPGIVQAILWVIHAYTKENEAIIIMPPVYYPFANSIRNSKRKLVESPLVEKDGTFKIDFEKFENEIANNDVKLYIHCSPHNPVGRVWTLEEQKRVFEICEKHNVLVLSDEIHQDFTYDKNKQISALSLENGKYNSRLIVANSGSKTFNLASLVHATLLIPDSKIREQFDKYSKKNLGAEPSLLGQIALEAGYREGDNWLNGLKETVIFNYNLLHDTLAQKVPEIIVYPLEGTYLAFVNIEKVLNGKTTKQFIQDECGLAIDFGHWFGEGYNNYIRINLATSPDNMKEAVSRIVENCK